VEQRHTKDMIRKATNMRASRTNRAIRMSADNDEVSVSSSVAIFVMLISIPRIKPRSTSFNYRQHTTADVTLVR